jgi:addiction module antidote protein, HigA family
MLPTHRKPTSPGKILWEEFLLPLNISQSDFAAHLGGTWTQPKLSAIISGKRSITEEIALDFADALGTSAEFWIGLQNDVNLWEASQRRRKIKRIPKRKVYVKRVVVPKSRMRSKV